MTKAEKPPEVDSYELRAGTGPGDFLARVSPRGMDRASSALDLVVLAWTCSREVPEPAAGGVVDGEARALRTATAAARRIAAKARCRVRVVEIREDGKEAEIVAVGPETAGTGDPLAAFVATLPASTALDAGTAGQLLAPVEDWLDSDLAIAVELPELVVVVCGLLVSAERRAALAGDGRLVLGVVEAYDLARSWAWAGLRTIADVVAVFEGRVAVAEGRIGTRMLEELIGPRPGTRGYAGPATLARFREDWRGWGAEYRTALLTLHAPLLAAIRREPDGEATDEEKLWAAAWAIRRLARREKARAA